MEYETRMIFYQFQKSSVEAATTNFLEGEDSSIEVVIIKTQSVDLQNKSTRWFLYDGNSAV